MEPKTDVHDASFEHRVRNYHKDLDSLMEMRLAALIEQRLKEQTTVKL